MENTQKAAFLRDVERACGADIVSRKIAVLDQAIGDKTGSGEPTFVILQAQRSALQEVWTELMGRQGLVGSPMADSKGR